MVINKFMKFVLYIREELLLLQSKKMDWEINYNQYVIRI